MRTGSEERVCFVIDCLRFVACATTDATCVLCSPFLPSLLSVNSTQSSVNLATVKAEEFAFLAQVLRVLLALVADVQSIRSIERTLLVRVDHKAAFDAHLTAVGPTVATHPLAATGRALVLAEAALLPLVRRQS